MTDEILKFKAGTAVQFTEGCYSDFGLTGAVVTLKDCDFVALGKEYIIAYADTNRWERPDFATWLVTNSHVFPAEIQQVHLDDGYHFDLHTR